MLHCTLQCCFTCDAVTDLSVLQACCSAGVFSSACMCTVSQLVHPLQGMLEKLAQQQLMAQIDMSRHVGTPVLLPHVSDRLWAATFVFLGSRGVP